MATSDDTGARTRLEQTIEAERAKLLQVHAVQKCLCEVLLYADDEDAVMYAQVAQVVATSIEKSVEQLDPLYLQPLIEEVRANALTEPAGS